MKNEYAVGLFGFIMILVGAPLAYTGSLWGTVMIIVGGNALGAFLGILVVNEIYNNWNDI